MITSRIIPRSPHYCARLTLITQSIFWGGLDLWKNYEGTLLRTQGKTGRSLILLPPGEPMGVVWPRGFNVIVRRMDLKVGSLLTMLKKNRERNQHSWRFSRPSL